MLSAARAGPEHVAQPKAKVVSAGGDTWQLRHCSKTAAKADFHMLGGERHAGLHRPNFADWWV